MSAGRWCPVEPDETVTCANTACRKQIVGRLVAGPRGGRTWCWLEDDIKTCSMQCAAAVQEREDVAEMDFEMQADHWLADQGIE